jgi:hypothetical protein
MRLTIMQNGLLKAAGAAAAAGILVLFTIGADAQTKKSACQGLQEAACKANSSCSWIKATKTKKGTARRAYCRTKTTPKKK